MSADGLGETTQALATVAKECGVYLVGGSIPERAGNKVYNTATAFDRLGQMVAKYRKMHLFDIDIPGKITFKESDTLTGGSELAMFDTGESVCVCVCECVCVCVCVEHATSSFPRVASRRAQGNSHTMNTIGGTGVKDGSRANVHNAVARPACLRELNPQRGLRA